MVPPTFSERLRTLRQEKGVSQAELAAAIGLGPSAISNYEQPGKRYPPLKTLKKLAEYFGCSVDYLIGRTNYRYGTLQELEATWPNGLQILHRASKEATPEQKQLIMAIIKTILSQNRPEGHAGPSREDRPSETLEGGPQLAVHPGSEKAPDTGAGDTEHGCSKKGSCGLWSGEASGGLVRHPVNVRVRRRS